MNRYWRTRWLEAQGIPISRQLEWHGALFHSYPPQCVVCGKEWRPDKPSYISIFGHICGLFDVDDDLNPIGAPLQYRWVNNGLDLVLPTGHLDSHVREMCIEHGDILHSVRDCTTTEWVELTMPLMHWQELWRDGQYWTLTVLRFIWKEIRDDFAYATHPVKAIKWFKRMKELGL